MNSKICVSDRIIWWWFDSKPNNEPTWIAALNYSTHRLWFDVSE
jgi:hypothetical protein